MQNEQETRKKAGAPVTGPPVPSAPETGDENTGRARLAPLTIASETLLAGRSEVHIRHRGEIYRLTLTRAGKLILHK